MGNFFNDLNSKLQTFMVGRNGADRLSRWSLGAAIVALAINIFIPNIFCSVISYALLFYSIYRMFSSNVAAREQEERRFDEFLERLKPGGKKKKDSGFTTRKGSSASKQQSAKKSFRCEECGQSLSVPTGKGKLKVTCPKCHHSQYVDS